MIQYQYMCESNSWCYFKENIEPLFDEIKEIISETNDGPEKELVNISWVSFSRNSAALFELIEKNDCVDIFAMTLRLLMEISADLCFICAYPGNISSLVKDVNKANRKIFKKDATYAYAAKIASNIYMRDDQGNRHKTEERVKCAYNEEQFEELYSYYCCYSHFNILSGIWTMYRRVIGDDAIVAHSMYLISFYPEIFRKLIVSYGGITNNERMKNYSFDKIRSVIGQYTALYEDANRY